MTAPDSWDVVVEEQGADSLHHLADPVSNRRTVRLMLPSAAAIVLGSSQPESHIDHEAAALAGLEIARRRSGGGAVLVAPGEQVWIDVLIPRNDSLWNDDILKAVRWVGESWRAALEDLGVSRIEGHFGRLIASEWSSMVCFAGLGPGELTLDGRKLMGLSQRRSRDWVKIQTLVPLRWRPEAICEVLNLDPAPRRECAAAIAESALAVSLPADLVIGSLLSHLPA